MRISDWSSDVCSSDLQRWRIQLFQKLSLWQKEARRQTISLTLHGIVERTIIQFSRRNASVQHDMRQLVQCIETLPHGARRVSPQYDKRDLKAIRQIRRANDYTQVTNAQLVCRLLIDYKITIHQHNI